MSSFFLVTSSLADLRTEARCRSQSWDVKYLDQNSASLICSSLSSTP